MAQKPLNFAVIGVGGYIAPRHLEAIKALGHTVVAAFDARDSVGILDRYFPDCQFFTEFERFQNHIEAFCQNEQRLDYVSICSPNYLHSSHIKFALSHGAHAICEKPLVLHEAEIDELADYEKRYDRRVYTILQLRVHEAVQALREKVLAAKTSIRPKITLDYVTSRGNWYHESWKGDVRKSGGLSTNIGIHFFDMLTWVFGEAESCRLLEKTPSREKGTLALKGADVEWTLSINRKDLPVLAIEQGKTTFRSMRINGETFEFSDGFTELHNKVYTSILAGHGYGLEAARPAIRIAERLRSSL